MSLQLTAGRMAAFSDGVIAVIITVMVLDLKVPAHNLSDLNAMRKVLPMVVIYALSFVEVGIYWVNHHYLIGELEKVSHGLLWANLGFLFTLSLIPFGTAWVGERGLTPFSLSVYLICCAVPAVSWIVLSIVVQRRTHVPVSLLKQTASSALYVGVIPVSYRSLAAAMLMLSAVTVLWIIPPKRVREMTRVNDRTPSSY